MVLCIANRTENWKTAHEFAPFFGNDDRGNNARQKLVKRLQKTNDAEGCETHLELFWMGMRDYLHVTKRADRQRIKNQMLIDCQSSFGKLRGEIANFDGFKDLKKRNYDMSLVNEDVNEALFRNLSNTEVDIVIETPSSLFIGEAKQEATLGADSRLVLVHQLIRQYVMAKSLLKTLDRKRRIVPFVVGNVEKGIKNSDQVQFMICQGWLKDCNVLDWEDIKVIAAT